MFQQLSIKGGQKKVLQCSGCPCDSWVLGKPQRSSDDGAVLMPCPAVPPVGQTCQGTPRPAVPPAGQACWVTAYPTRIWDKELKADGARKDSTGSPHMCFWVQCTPSARYAFLYFVLAQIFWSRYYYYSHPSGKRAVTQSLKFAVIHRLP